VTSRIACAVLAAGASSRLGTPKQLVSLGGRPLVRRAVDEARASGCEDLAVVVGAHAGRVERAVAGSGAVVLRNGRWSDGVGTSIAQAACWAIARGDAALVLLVCDQPRLSSLHIDALVAAWRDSEAAGQEAMVASEYDGVRGVPAIFPASSFGELARLEGDRGGASLLRGDRHVLGVPWQAGALDVDTPRELELLGALDP